MRKRRVVGIIYEMKYSWKGHKDRNRRQEQNKKEWASSVGLCQKKKTATSPPCEGEPAEIHKAQGLHANCEVLQTEKHVCLLLLVQWAASSTYSSSLLQTGSTDSVLVGSPANNKEYVLLVVDSQTAGNTSHTCCQFYSEDCVLVGCSINSNV